MKKPHPAGGTGRGLAVRTPLRFRRTLRSRAPMLLDDCYSTTCYSTTWTMRRVRGSTSTVRPFTTV